MASQSLERQYAEGLKEQGYAAVPFAINGADIDPLFEEFQDFLNLCEEPGGEKFADAIAYTPRNRQSGGDYFVDRRRIGKVNPHAINQAPSTEDKDVAHIGPTSLALAERRLGRPGVPNLMRQFLGSCIELHSAAKDSARPVLGAVGLEDLFAAAAPVDQHVVRLIRYLGTVADLQAGLHFDRCVATVAAWESHPGLVGISGQNGQRESQPVTVAELDAAEQQALKTPIAHRSGEAKVFLGAGYNRMPQRIHEANGKLPLLLHGVVNERPQEERYAVVVFMHPPAGYPGYLVPDKYETGIEGVRAYLLNQEEVAQSSEVA